MGLTGRGCDKTKDKRQKTKEEEYNNYICAINLKVWNIMETKKNDLADRLFEFAVRVIEFLKTIPYTPENKIIRNQLAKSSTSSGANYEESQGGCSKLEFGNKVRIAAREMRESNYWLRIANRTVAKIDISENKYLISESGELLNILGSIAQKLR
jgi:four helix bundle protein